MNSEITKLILDFGQNKIAGEYSNKTPQEINEKINNAVFSALAIDPAKIKTEIDLAKALRGKENLVYAIIEEVISEGSFKRVTEIPFFDRFVEYRNLSEGDDVIFYAEGLGELTVSRLAGHGVEIQKQRLDNGAQYTVDMDTYGIGVIEFLKRIMLGRADWSTLTAKLDEAVERFIAQKAYTAFRSTLTKLPTPFVFAGTYDEEEVMKVIERVEASSGVKPILAGTRSALSKLKGIEWASYSDAMKDARNSLGYVPVYNGYDCMVIEQQLVAGTIDEFVFAQDEIYILATAEKPIKVVVREGLIGNGEEKTHQNQSIAVEYVFDLGISTLAFSGMGLIKLA